MADKKKKELSIIQERVLAMIPRETGKEVLSKDIAYSTGLEKRDVMAVINTLIMDHNIPIGAGRSKHNKGYFIITNEAQLRMAIQPLNNSIIVMQQRVRKLESIKFDS